MARAAACSPSTGSTRAGSSCNCSGRRRTEASVTARDRLDRPRPHGDRALAGRAVEDGAVVAESLRLRPDIDAAERTLMSPQTIAATSSRPERFNIRSPGAPRTSHTGDSRPAQRIESNLLAVGANYDETVSVVFPGGPSYAQAVEAVWPRIKPLIPS
jgi:hypothetical protein